VLQFNKNEKYDQALKGVQGTLKEDGVLLMNFGQMIYMVILLTMLRAIADMIPFRICNINSQNVGCRVLYSMRLKNKENVSTLQLQGPLQHTRRECHKVLCSCRGLYGMCPKNKENVIKPSAAAESLMACLLK
jgi:hypothetical protein